MESGVQEGERVYRGMRVGMVVVVCSLNQMETDLYHTPGSPVNWIDQENQPHGHVESFQKQGGGLPQMGRGPWRERVEIRGAAVSLKKKKLARTQ